MSVVVLVPLLYGHRDMSAVIGFVVLPLAERFCEITWLSRHPQNRQSLLKTRLFVRLCVFTATLALVLVTDEPVLLPAMVLGMSLSFMHQYIFADYATEYPLPGQASADAGQVRSARLYDGMVITSAAALNIFAFTYVLYVLLRRQNTFYLDLFGGIAATGRGSAALSVHFHQLGA